MAILKPSPSSPSRLPAGTFTSDERERRGVGRALAHLVEVLLDRHAVRVHRNDERGEPLVPLAPVGGGEHHRPRCVAGVGDEHLGAVQHVLVAVPLGRRLDPGRVGAGVRLAERERAEERLLEERRQPLPLLLVASRRSAPGRRRGCSRRSTTAMPEQPQESSSPMSMPSKPGKPGPPYSSGTWTFISPTSCALATTSAGCVCCSSYSAAFGRISLSANSRASARSSLLLVVQGERDAGGDAGLHYGHEVCSRSCRLTGQSKCRSAPAARSNACLTAPGRVDWRHGCRRTPLARVAPRPDRRVRGGRAAGGVPRRPRSALEGVLPALLQRPDPSEGVVRHCRRGARGLPALHGCVDLREAALAQAGLGEPGPSLVGTTRVRRHASRRLPLHLQARLPVDGRPRALALVVRLLRLRRLRGQGHDRAPAAVSTLRAAARGRAPLHHARRVWWTSARWFFGEAGWSSRDSCRRRLSLPCARPRRAGTDPCGICPQRGRRMPPWL